MTTEHVTRFVQGIRVYCKECKKDVTPILTITNDDGRSTKIDMRCDSCGRDIAEAVIVSG